MCPCKSETHVANYCKYKLSRDRKKSCPTPMYVDHSKTIAATYSQGSQLVFAYDARFRESAPLYIVLTFIVLCKVLYSNIFYGIVFYCIVVLLCSDILLF